MAVLARDEEGEEGMNEPPLDLNPQSPTYVGDDRAHDHAISECLGALSCPIHGEAAAHVHHRDGNPRNNDVDNIEVRSADLSGIKPENLYMQTGPLHNHVPRAVARCTTWDDPCEDQGCPVHGTRPGYQVVYDLVKLHGGPLTNLYYRPRLGAMELVRRIGDVDHVYDAITGEYKGTR